MTRTTMLDRKTNDQSKLTQVREENFIVAIKKGIRTFAFSCNAAGSLPNEVKNAETASVVKARKETGEDLRLTKGPWEGGTPHYHFVPKLPLNPEFLRKCLSTRRRPNDENPVPSP